MKEFRRIVRSLSTAHLHAMWTLEHISLSVDQRIVVRMEAKRRRTYMTPEELASEHGMWLDDMLYDVNDWINDVDDRLNEPHVGPTELDDTDVDDTDVDDNDVDELE